MQFLLRIILIVTICIIAPVALAAPIRVMTYNILFDNPSAPWADRRTGVQSIVQAIAPDVFGVQEALAPMIQDLQLKLPHHGWVGFGRDSNFGGEHSALFFRRDRFELKDAETFWLSEDPYLPGSMSWGSSLPRVATWVRLKEKTSGQEYFIVNTHLDHRSGIAREHGTNLILKQIRAIAGNAFVVLFGDFNSSRTDTSYKYVTNFLSDAEVLSQTPHFGPKWSFRAVGGLYKTRIDFIFVDPRLKVLRHGIVDQKWNDDFPSDHLPVTADLESAD